MTETFYIAGYCRISVDDELDKENTSIENQKAIIEDYVKHKFPGSKLTFYEDRDRSGYTFEQREGYQEMRRLLMAKEYDILIVKDFSRFSRRNSRGLVELEDLKDAGVRIISIGDCVDFPKDDDWLKIQFQFIINEMPVTDTSKKVKSVIQRRQADGKWICSVPYGYVITNNKTMAFEVDEPSAEVVRKVFELYNNGYGYKRIANYLTDQNIPTPRMVERMRKEAKGEESKRRAKAEWSIVTVQGILANDFYIGTLRQGKYTRRKINGSDIKKDVSEHIVFENHHEPIVDYRTFAIAQEQMKKRSTDNYRGVKKYDNNYSGLMECGDCGSPMFPMSRADLKEAYRCGAYHQRGLKGCTSHHIRVDKLDELLKMYLAEVRNISETMIKNLEKQIADETSAVKKNEEAVAILEKQLEDAKEELKILTRQKTREIIQRPEREATIEEVYTELMNECQARIDGLENQITLTIDQRNTVIRVNRIANTAIDIFSDILDKDKLDKKDLDLLVERIYVYEDHIHIKLKADIECILRSGSLPETVEEAANFNSGTKNIEKVMEHFASVMVQSAKNQPDKVFSVNIISNGDPLEIYTDREGEVIFKKYSPMGELGSFSSQYAETLHKTCGLSVVITDRDGVVAAAGVPKREFSDKRVSDGVEKLLEGRAFYRLQSGGKRIGVTDDEGSYYISGAMPIITGGDVAGCVMSVVKDENERLDGELEEKLIRTAAGFLSKQMEE